jgi:hypothetical protein
MKIDNFLSYLSNSGIEKIRKMDICIKIRFLKIRRIMKVEKRK